eukprot:scaffold175925_cov17-Tisochrysis_lutea.AAC.1
MLCCGKPHVMLQMPLFPFISAAARDEGSAALRQALDEARCLVATKEAERAAAAKAAAQQGPLIDALEAELSGLKCQVDAVRASLSNQQESMAQHSRH